MTFEELPPDLQEAFKYYRGRKRAMAVEIATVLLPILKRERDGFGSLDEFHGFSYGVAESCIRHVRAHKQ